MNVQSIVPAGYESAVIWEWPDGQQLIGPQVAELGLAEPAEGVSPYPLELAVALTDQQRYVITRLVVHAESTADAAPGEGRSLSHPLRVERLLPSTTLPPVTARGVAEIRLPTVLRQGLYGKCRMRYRNAQGDLVEGVDRSLELPMLYLVARASGEHPTKAVAEAFGLGASAAAQRVKRARDDGLLPATTKGAR